MIRILTLLRITIGLAAAAWAAHASVQSTSQGPVYSLAEVRGQLTRDPQEWLGRIVRVRARAQLCPPEIADAGVGCSPWHPVLAPLEASDPTEPLPLVRGSGFSLSAFVRRLTLLDYLLPGLQVVDWGSVSSTRWRK
jgi:hypothetical protein